MHLKLKNKILCSLTLAASFSLELDAQPLQLRSAAEATPTPISSDQTTWQRVSTFTTAFGKTVYRTNQYEQIGSGLNYLTEKGWAPSRAEFELFENGAIARHGQNQLICSPSANSAPMLDVLAVDGKRFRTRVLGIIYAEPGPDGRSVLVAETKDSIGQLDPSSPSQIVYPEAFDSNDGIHADLIIIYRKGGWEQNVVFRTQPPDPGEWGLQNASIELWTEQLFDTPEPIIQTAVSSSPANPGAGAEPANPDGTELDFGGTSIGAGTAFLTGGGEQDGQGAETVPISKSWVTTPEQRRFLVEAASYAQLRPLLVRLPVTAAVKSKTNDLLMASVSIARRRGAPGATAKALPKAKFLAKLPKLELAATKPTGKIQLAQNDRSGKRGLAMDYSQFTVSTNLTNWVFRSDTTTYIADEVDLRGTTVLEGGCVLKFSTNSTARLLALGPILCGSDPWHPITCTAKDDDSVGEQISGSSHVPTNYYAGAAYFDLSYGTVPFVIHDIKVLYADVAFKLHAGLLNLDNAQILYGDYGFINLSTGGTSTIRNVLFYKTFRPFYSTLTNVVTVCEHLTVHQVAYLIYGSAMPNLLLTNSLLISVTNGARYDGANVQTSLDDTGIFISAGQGAHYLPILSSYRAAGNTNVSTNVLASLQMRTTTAPIILSNNVDAYPILNPVVPRGFATAPDLGYAYFPADFIIQGVVLNTNTLLLTNGVNLAVDCSYTNYGFLLGTNGTLISESDPLHLNHILRTRSIQESAVVDKTGSATFASLNTTTPRAVLRMRFTDLPLQAGEYHLNDPDGSGGLQELTVEDCQLRAGSLFASPNAYNTNYSVTFWNSLFERVTLQIHPYNLGGTLQAHNDLFFGGSVTLVPMVDGTFKVFDTLFDQTVIGILGAHVITHDYNGYLTNFSRLTPSALNDVVLTNATMSYQTGFLSHYYVPLGSRLINAGSQTANYSGLYWYCSGTNQVAETNSQVDIGWHQVALDANNQPLDGDGDLLPSYYEDRNGNGSVEPDESDPANVATYGIPDYLLFIQGRRYATNSLFADTNNLINLRVYTPLK